MLKAGEEYVDKKTEHTRPKYGWFTVISPVENIGKETAWLCRCDCGNQLVARTKYLRSGRVKSCGCHKSNYNVENLHYVEGTCIEMIASRKIRCNNTSGCTGVSKVKKTGRWRAEIMIGGKRKNLGTYEKLEEAIIARKEAEIKYFNPIIEKYKL